MKKEKSRSRLLAYNDVYRSDVFPIFKDYEKSRLDFVCKYRIKAFIKFFFPLLFLMFLSVISFIYPLGDIDSLVQATLITIFSIFLPLVLVFFSIDRKKESVKFNRMMKCKVLKDLLTVFGNIRWRGHDVTCANTGNLLLTDDELNESALFISYNTRYTDDEFEGSYKDVSFKISETKMFDVRGSGKNRSSICAFDGIVLSFKFNKKINNRTIVATKGDLTKKNQTLISVLFSLALSFEVFRNGYAHWKLFICICIFVVSLLLQMNNVSQEEPLDKVILEDPLFNKRFNVYSSDQITARYLVTPAFMQRFYNLKTAFGAKKAKCSFYDDTLMIAIQTKKDLFEICSLFKSLEDPSSIREFYRELDSIYKMIEYFKLDENIGM